MVDFRQRGGAVQIGLKIRRIVRRRRKARAAVAFLQVAPVEDVRSNLLRRQAREMAGGKQKLQSKLAYLADFTGTVKSMADKGMSEKEIIRSLDKGDDKLLKLITMGNMSFGNMVRSTLRS